MIQKSVFSRFIIIISLGLVVIFAFGCDRYLDIITKPPESSRETDVFTVFGKVYQSDLKTLVSESLIVTVKNLTLDTQLITTTGREAGEGRYSVTFEDTDKNCAASIGDTIQVTVAKGTSIVGEPAKYTVTMDDITLGSAVINFVIELSVEKIATNVFVIEGVVYQADRQTPVTRSMTVHITNLTSGLTQITQTGGKVNTGCYSVTFIDKNNNRVAVSGDQIEVTVTDDNGKMWDGLIKHTISADEIRSGRAIINVTIPYLHSSLSPRIGKRSRR